MISEAGTRQARPLKVLFLTHRLPYAPNRGDRSRAYFLMRELSTFADVTLFSLVHDDDEASREGDVPFAARVVTTRAPRLRNYVRGALSLPSSKPLTHSLLDAPDAARRLRQLVESDPPDVVLAFCSGMARFAMAPPLDRFPFVLDMVDVDSEKWRSLAERSAFPKRWIYRREQRTLSAFERQAALDARATFVVSEAERTSLLALAPDAAVTVVPIGVDLESFAPAGPPAVDPVVVFCGVMDYAPNVDGVVWFATEVWPRVLEQRPDARFIVVGSQPAPEVRRLAEHDPSISVTGRVDAVQPYLWRAAVAVAPLRVARGVQSKVLEAIASGLPVVVTPAVSAGLPPDVRQVCPVAADAEAFARTLSRLLGQPPAERRAMAEAAHIGRMAWTRQFTGLQAMLQAAAGVQSAEGVRC